MITAMQDGKALYVVRMFLVISLVYTIGLLFAYPRCNSDSDLPAPFSEASKEVRRKADRVNRQLIESRRNLRKLRSYGRYSDRRLTEEEQLLKERRLEQRWIAEQLEKQGIKTSINELAADKKVLSELNTDAAFKAEIPKVENLDISSIRKVILLVANNLASGGFINRKQALACEYLTDKAFRNSDEKSLERIVDSLYDPETLKSTARAVFAIKPMVVIGSYNRDTVAGSLVSRDRNGIIDFNMARRGLPETIEAELRKYRLTHSPILRLIWLTAALSAAVLIQVECSLARKMKKSYGSVVPSQARYSSTLSDRITILKSRKNQADNSAASHNGLVLKEKHGFFTPLTAVFTALIVLSIASIGVFYHYGHPRVPYIDTALQAYVAERINTGESVVFP